MWQCPKCSSRDLRVVIETWAVLTQYGCDDFQTYTDGGGAHEWGKNSLMECVSCGFSEISREFEVVAGEHTPDTDGAARALAVELLNRRTVERDRAVMALKRLADDCNGDSLGTVKAPRWAILCEAAAAIASADGLDPSPIFDPAINPFADRRKEETSA